ncbi:MAG: class I SAM-dependent methyltransferase [Bacteroidales bacterium]
MLPDFWNQRYDSDEFVYGIHPNQFFKEFVDSHQPGKLLLPCEGEGRNAVYAAKLGWDVVAFDQSEVGRKKALKLAEKNQTQIHFEVADALEFDYQSGKYDVIAFLWAHFPPDIRRKVHQKAVSGLKPGGHILLEGFSKKQLAFTSGGPKAPEMLFSLDYWPEDFPGLSTITLEETTTLLEEGDFHRGEAAVVRFLGRYH